MKKFRFSLDTLLSLRREKEQECEIALAHAAGELMSIDGRIAEARGRSERVFLAGGTTLGELIARDRVVRKADADVKALREPRKEAARKVEAARSEYARAHSERAALDRLKDKKRQLWKAEGKREEIARLDETAKGALVRKRLTGGDE